MVSASWPRRKSNNRSACEPRAPRWTSEINKVRKRRSRHSSLIAKSPCKKRTLCSAPFVAVESAVNSRSIQFETDFTSFIVAPPNVPQRRELRLLQRRRRAGSAKDHPDSAAAGSIDGVPKRADFLGRHPILRVQENDSINLPRRKAFQKQPEVSLDGNDQSGTVAHASKLAALQIRWQAAIAGSGVTAAQRLPGKIVYFVGVAIDQAQQPFV